MMSDQSNQPAGDPEKDVAAELQQELREMGKQLEAAFRTTLESDRAKRVQADLAAGARELSSQVRTAVENFSKSEALQEAEERGRQAINQARQSKVVHEMQDLLLAGISQINSQLSKLVERMEQESKPATPTQHVPVDHEPTTGETTKLD
jgi:heparin binding hemagglutinin HbhA